MLKHKNILGIVTLLIAVFVYCRINFGSSYWWLVLIAIFFLTLTAIGAFHIRWNYFLTSLHKSFNTNKKQIAITFDDGPNPEFTKKTLDLLKQFDAQATFFCIGRNIEKHPEILKEVFRNGHEIGNHSYIHSNEYGFFSTDKIKQDIAKNATLIKEAIGKTPLLFRPPFGVTNPKIARAIISLKLTSIGWSVRSYDTQAKSAKKILEKILPKIKNGDLLLLHDTSNLSIEVLEQLLLFLREKKIKAVTVGELLNIEVYE